MNEIQLCYDYKSSFYNKLEINNIFVNLLNNNRILYDFVEKFYKCLLYLLARTA